MLRRLGVWRRGLFKKGWGLGLGNLVEEGKISYILSGGREGDDRRKFVAPQDLVWQVGGAHLAGGRGRLHGSAHDYKQLKVSQLRICPPTTLEREIHSEKKKGQKFRPCNIFYECKWGFGNHSFANKAHFDSKIKKDIHKTLKTCTQIPLQYNLAQCTHLNRLLNTIQTVNNQQTV